MHVYMRSQTSRVYMLLYIFDFVVRVHMRALSVCVCVCTSYTCVPSSRVVTGVVHDVVHDIISYVVPRLC